MRRIVLRRCDLRRDTFRAGGPGGQHQNKTESGVRYTHLPTGEVGASRSERSQSANDKIALAMLVARLEERVLEAERRAARAGYEAKPEPSFGAQARSYVLDRDRRVVDHRTDHVETDVRAVVGRGRIDGFIRAALLARCG